MVGFGIHNLQIDDSAPVEKGYGLFEQAVLENKMHRMDFVEGTGEKLDFLHVENHENIAASQSEIEGDAIEVKIVDFQYGLIPDYPDFFDCIAVQMYFQRLEFLKVLIDYVFVQ